MTSKLEEIQSECPNIQTMSIDANFNEFDTIEQYRTTIADKLTDLDLSVLITTPTYNKNKEFTELDNSDIQSTI